MHRAPRRLRSARDRDREARTASTRRSWSGRPAWPATCGGSATSTPRSPEQHRRRARAAGAAPRSAASRLAARTRRATTSSGSSAVIVRHRQCGADLVWEAYNVDIGGLDSRRVRAPRRLPVVVRIALGQLNTTVGDLDGQRRAPGRVGRPRDRRRRRRRSSSPSSRHRLPARGPRPAPGVRAATTSPRSTRSPRRPRAGATSSSGSSTARTRALHNAAAVLRGGRVAARYHKCKLPNYGVFDEQRYFVPGEAGVHRRRRAARTSACRSARTPGRPARRSTGTRRGVPIMANINASPYHRGKADERLDVLPRAGRARPARGSCT